MGNTAITSLRLAGSKEQGLWAGEHENMGILQAGGPTGGKENLSGFFKAKVPGQPSKAVLPKRQSSEFPSSHLFPRCHPHHTLIYQPLLFIFTRFVH